MRDVNVYRKRLGKRTGYDQEQLGIDRANKGVLQITRRLQGGGSVETSNDLQADGEVRIQIFSWGKVGWGGWTGFGRKKKKKSLGEICTGVEGRGLGCCEVGMDHAKKKKKKQTQGNTGRIKKGWGVIKPKSV